MSNDYFEEVNKQFVDWESIVLFSFIKLSGKYMQDTMYP